ncbi:MAG TPA: hypothetical protein VGX23_06480 [Actinocrinis sp.]|nr:hypothetical protein [Actinocrinis sp.]
MPPTQTSTPPPTKPPAQLPPPPPLSPRAWHLVKKVADYALLIFVVGAVGWSATTAVSTVRQTTANRAVVQVHLSTNPVQLPDLNATFFPAGTGVRTELVRIIIANDSPDGVFVKSAALTGPYLAAPTPLSLPNNGYIPPGMSTAGVGEVTVDCGQTAGLLGQIRAGTLDPNLAPTNVTVKLTDANRQNRTFTLTVDTTAAAIQGQVCTA